MPSYPLQGPLPAPRSRPPRCRSSRLPLPRPRRQRRPRRHPAPRRARLRHSPGRATCGPESRPRSPMRSTPTVPTTLPMWARRTARASWACRRERTRSPATR
ncbi:hypothetical protein EPN52_13870 [bacterium]|nr:MAG: hypothetical protein EPN52_13870 [bacterium]